MKILWITAGIILALGLTAAGSFYGGTLYQINQAEQARSEFFSARGQPGDGQLPGTGMNMPEGMPEGQGPAGQMPGGFGGGTTGVVKTIDGNVMTISTAQDVTSVNLSEDTPVLQTVTGTLANLEPGMQVRIIGQADENGAITASQIVILDDSQAGLPAFGQPTERQP